MGHLTRRERRERIREEIRQRYAEPAFRCTRCERDRYEEHEGLIDRVWVTGRHGRTRRYECFDCGFKGQSVHPALAAIEKISTQIKQRLLG